MTATNNRTTSPGLLPRAVLLAWAAAVLGTIVGAPIASSAGRAEGWFLYEAFGPFCHQQPERSWHVSGYPLAVCVRCLGFYAGLLLATLAGLRLPVKAFLWTLALLGASWAAEWSGLVAASAGVRFVTGAALGFCAGAGMLSCFAGTEPRSRRMHRAHSIA